MKNFNRQGKVDMNKITSEKSDIFNEIEKLYFSNKFDEVIEVWEKSQVNYQIDNKSQTDNNILEAVATSYYELGMLKKSLHYIDAQIKQLTALELPAQELEKKYRYYNLSKVNIYQKLNKRVLEYRVIRKYLKSSEEDDAFKKLSHSLEEYFYRKYLIINKYFGYIVLVLVVLAILVPLFGFHIPGNIYKPYNIVSIILLIWIVLNLLFPKTFKKFLLQGLRFSLSHVKWNPKEIKTRK